MGGTALEPVTPALCIVAATRSVGLWEGEAETGSAPPACAAVAPCVAPTLAALPAEKSKSRLMAQSSGSVAWAVKDSNLQHWD